MPAYQTDRKLYLNKDQTKVVEEGDPSASFVFKAAGDEVTEEEAKQYGLRKGKAVQEEEVEAAEDIAQEEDRADEKEVSTKKVKPAENKAFRGRPNKAR